MIILIYFPINQQNEVFVIDFTCGSSDKNLCEKAKNAFASAGQRIASVIQFNTPVKVNATFTALGPLVLGQALPARTIPLKDHDGIIRLYPQALVKQMQFPSHPEFNTYDITALFSSTADVYFKEDTTIQQNQADFEYIITHEFIHGLGFLSNWNEYFLPDFLSLTPSPVFLNDITDPSKPINYTGFTEAAFDRYMMLNQGTYNTTMTALAQNISNFAPIGTEYASLNVFENAFISSPESYIAGNLSLATITPYTMGFMTHDSSLVVLETKLNPFFSGSSIDHVDTYYANTSDFIMIYVSLPGIRLDDLDKKYGGVIGPYITKILETLGFV
ncbi:9921_t:CDS:2 [Acaulospora morrowiae]|uniref:9921_t:CDS:1 n=1 Tax=Acaulospora morrowiae TaxID=94023 RepID=A0A9N9C0V2_9GLOM|nr:9921_t:CDS:2 [Acaulospora morrowiae]